MKGEIKMKTVKTLQDRRELKRQDSISKALFDHIEEYFFELVESLSEGKDINEFSLEESGYMVILEKGDDVRNLEEVGLNPKDKGLLGTYPEWVEVKKLSDGSEIYQIGVLYNNDYMQLFYSYRGQFDKEVEEFLADEAGIITA